jgi:23S rRNA (cytidine1920-2'-O)/16S rRNA (cytidine1409-2'-O)-methyltransferase
LVKHKKFPLATEAKGPGKSVAAGGSQSMVAAPKIRLDTLLVEQGWAQTRERARSLIMAGVVWCEGRRLAKPGLRVPADSPLEVKSDPCPYVSRGGLKLAAALGALAVDPTGLVCADVGASTGGFTDCLLQHGAARVHAIDVGRNQLHERLRADPRVISHERVNARHLTPDALPEPVCLLTADVSFISLRLILPAAANILARGARVLALVKPQFEAGREQVHRGVVRDPRVHAEVLRRIDVAAAELGWARHGACLSPIRGPAGNREYFVLWDSPTGSSAEAASAPADWTEPLISQAFEG